MNTSTTQRYGLKSTDITAMHGVFARHPQVEQVLLYGSRAKGNYRPGSDIDLTLKGPQLDLGIRFRIETELDDLLLPYQMDLSLLAHIKNEELLEHIERVGVVFYAKNDNASEGAVKREPDTQPQ